MTLKELTKAEEEIMHFLWQLEAASVKEIIAEMDIPKPAVNTVSTIVRILEQKGFVDHRGEGHEAIGIETALAFWEVPPRVFSRIRGVRVMDDGHQSLQEKQEARQRPRPLT